MPFLDPSHERAGGNLRYFERLLEEEREKTVLNQTEAEPATQDGFYERPSDYLPERDVYESLCRGEGVKLVSHMHWLRGPGLGLRCHFWILHLGSTLLFL